jgi:hypothetical protein
MGLTFVVLFWCLGKKYETGERYPWSTRMSVLPHLTRRGTGSYHRYIHLSRRTPVSHLLFADECFLFFKADVQQSQIMKNILTTYEAASGQAISLSKSEIYCTRNVSDTMKASITNILGVQSVLGTGKYLGLPSMLGRDRNSTFACIKDRDSYYLDKVSWMSFTVLWFRCIFWSVLSASVTFLLLVTSD